MISAIEPKELEYYFKDIEIISKESMKDQIEYDKYYENKRQRNKRKNNTLKSYITKCFQSIHVVPNKKKTNARIIKLKTVQWIAKTKETVGGNGWAGTLSCFSKEKSFNYDRRLVSTLEQLSFVIKSLIFDF